MRYQLFYFWHKVVKGHGFLNINVEKGPKLALCSCGEKYGRTIDIECVLAQAGTSIEEIKEIWK
jgi:hypothetical protein